MEKIKKLDKRIVIIYIFCIGVILLGITYALTSPDIGLNVATANLGIDESNYGNTTFDSSNLKLYPILDNKIDPLLNGTSTDVENNVILISFKVGGASSNPTNTPIIYDIALNNLFFTDELLSKYVKWKLVKNNEVISTGSLSNDFDTITNGRLVLTEIQQDLVKYNASASGYDEYKFVLWLSDACQDENITKCIDTENQDNLLSKTISGKIEVELYTGNKKALVRNPGEETTFGGYAKLLTTYIKSLYNDGSSISTVHIGAKTNKPEVNLNSTQSIMLDNNGDYRYYGSSPNNYVSFNNELWRIIGVFQDVESDSGIEATRVKIIKATSIGDYSYDSSASTVNSGQGINDWSKSDLMTELNTLYYNSQSGTCYNGENNASTTCNFTNTGLNSSAQNMTSNAVYYLGGKSSLLSLYASDYYTYERGTTVYNCSTDDGACPRATTWTGIIGIMYPSDYAYATDLSLCTKEGYHYESDTNCTENDWLFDTNAWQWAITPRTMYRYRSTYIDTTGYIRDIDNSSAGAVRPVLYLNSNIGIIGGDGTVTNPYLLS